LAAGGYRKAIRVASEDHSFFGTVLHTTLLTAPKGHAAMVMAMEDAADEETAKRLRKVDFLNLVGQLAPMAGLFGTVYGMILAFQSIVSAGGNADPVLLAGGIGTALVTTFWGLVVAIPALMGYAVIRNRILNASEAVIAEVTKLIRPFDADLRKASAPAAKPASSIEPSGDSASERRTNAQSNASMAGD
jgi:biopolymer transport protein ExbB